MNSNVLYDLYTSDYSAATVRTAPVTKKALLLEGVEMGVAEQYFVLCEKLYYSFLDDVMVSGGVRESTLSIWQKLLVLCENSGLTLLDDFSYQDMFDRFPFRWNDILLQHGKIRVPRDSGKFRFCVEQKLSDINLTERLLEYEYNLVFVARNSDVDHMRIVRPNAKTGDLDEVPLSEIKGIISKLQLHQHKIQEKLDATQISAELADAGGSTEKIKIILERNYSLHDELNALEDLRYRLQEILDQPTIYTLSSHDFLHVITGEDTCARDNHLVFDIKVEMTFADGHSRHFVIRRCAACKQYRIGYSAFQRIVDEHGFPKVMIQYGDLQDAGIDGCWKDSSVFSQHGYSTSLTAGLTATQRQAILTQLIKCGYCSRQEAIAYLNNRISYNGKKPENWLAVKKWQEDLTYIINLKL